MKVLVAGIGNIFLRDDGFGPAVACRLAEEVSGLPGWAPPEVQVQDYGVRGLHLAYDLLDGVEALVLVDVLPAPPDGSGRAGNLRIMRIRAQDLDASGPLPSAALPVNPAFDPHGMDPLAVLRRLRVLGGTLPPTYLVGCVAARTDEGMGLSEPVARAVPEAVEAVRTLVTTQIPAAADRPGSAGPAGAGPAGAESDRTGEGVVADVLGNTWPDHRSDRRL
jgi:hydrogenase maturation protease